MFFLTLEKLHAKEKKKRNASKCHLVSMDTYISTFHEDVVILFRTKTTPKSVNASQTSADTL